MQSALRSKTKKAFYLPLYGGVGYATGSGWPHLQGSLLGNEADSTLRVY